jgi:hypothetical protein
LAEFIAIKGSGIALDPLQRRLIRTEKAAAFTQYRQSVLFYLTTLVLHTKPKGLSPRQCLFSALLDHVGHVAPYMPLSHLIISSTEQKSQPTPLSVVKQCTDLPAFSSFLCNITVRERVFMGD